MISIKNVYCKVCGWIFECSENVDFDICSCCGTQRGYEDLSEENIILLRKAWLQKGSPWFAPEKKPEYWSLEEQLRRIN